MSIINTPMTKHAECRIKQRGIPMMMLELLLDFGKRMDRGDTCTLVFDKTSFKALKSYGGTECLALVRRFADIYAVISKDSEVVITAGHRSKNSKFRDDGYRRNTKATLAV